MYLSRLHLDLKKNKTVLALVRPTLFHGAVESAFPGARKRNLWRIDKLGEEQYLLLLSEDKPDLSAVAEQFGIDGEGWITKDYDTLFERIEEGTSWRFKLSANPTHSQSSDGKTRGKIQAYTATHDQRQWLLKQSEKRGFSVEEDSFDVTSSMWYTFTKGRDNLNQKKQKVSMLSATYEGILTVTDAAAFKKTLTCGIGREKAYGVGLMTLMRADV